MNLPSVSGYSAEAQGYVDGVLSGAIPACTWVKLACQRSMRDLSKQGAPDWPFIFDAERARKVVRFVQTLRHVSGEKANERIYLEPWQKWVMETSFGWLWADTRTRRFRRVWVEVPKGNGKSLLASAIALYCAFAEGEKGADVITAASTLAQARIVLDTAQTMLRKDTKLAANLGVDVLAHKILQPKTVSKLRSLPSKAGSIEGLAIHAGIVDEMHVHRNRDVYDSLSTACTKRAQSILWMITTAGIDSAGIGFELHTFAERLLEGEATDESVFAVIYTTDATDSWESESTWRKANPNFGISVEPRAFEEECKRAVQLPSQRHNFRIKLLNEWVSSNGDDSFLDFTQIKAAYDQNLDEKSFEGSLCTVGMDLASTTDLCAVVRVHSRREEDDKIHHYAFTRTWLPESAVDKSRVASLRGWAEQGWLDITPGSLTDMDCIERAVVQASASFNIRDLSYDPLQSTQLVGHLQAQGIDTAEVTQFPRYIATGMRALEELVAGGTFHFNSPVLKWCLDNLQVHRSPAGLLFPRRPKDRALKIDAAVALIMALKSVYTQPLDVVVEKNPYSNRGISFI